MPRVSNIHHGSPNWFELRIVLVFKTVLNNIKIKDCSWVQHSQEGRGCWISEVKASQVYNVSSRIPRSTNREPVLKNRNKQSNCDTYKHV